MKDFIPPSIGSKLGEYKPSYLKRLNQRFNENLEPALRFIFAVILPLYLGINLILDPFSPNWASFLLGGFLSLIAPTVVIAYFYAKIKLSNERVIKPLKGRSFSLYLVRDGLEINNIFIPFQKKDPYSFELLDGVVSIKLDGDFLLLRTQGLPFVCIPHNNLTENEIKFTIDPKFQFCKEELLSYLNSLIPTS